MPAPLVAAPTAPSFRGCCPKPAEFAWDVDRWVAADRFSLTQEAGSHRETVLRDDRDVRTDYGG